MNKRVTLRTETGWVLRWTKVLEAGLRLRWGEPTYPMQGVPRRIPEEPNRLVGCYKVWVMNSDAGVIRVIVPRWSKCIVPGPLACLTVEIEQPELIPDDVKVRQELHRGRMHIREQVNENVNPDIAAEKMIGFLERLLVGKLNARKVEPDEQN